MFDDKIYEAFFSITHQIAPSANRWAYKLETNILSGQPGQEIISSGVFPGTIQILHSGQPIILMADAQTTGGYPRIAVVISADMDKLAQAKPGDTLRFLLVNRFDAVDAMAVRDNWLSAERLNDK